MADNCPRKGGDPWLLKVNQQNLRNRPQRREKNRSPQSLRRSNRSN